jgi:hypothetical protein
MIPRILQHLARAFLIGSGRPVLESAQFLPRVAGLFQPALADCKDFFPIVVQGDWQRGEASSNDLNCSSLLRSSSSSRLRAEMSSITAMI